MIPFIDILDRIGKKAYRIFLYWIQDILRQLVKHFKKSQNRKENKSPKSKYWTKEIQEYNNNLFFSKTKEAKNQTVIAS